MGAESGRRSLRTEERPLNLTIGKALVIFKRAVWREWEEQTPIAEIKQGNGWRGQLRLVAEITHRECLGGERENWEGSEKRPVEESKAGGLTRPCGRSGAGTFLSSVLRPALPGLSHSWPQPPPLS